jgi:hypothetical protein
MNECKETGKNKEEEQIFTGSVNLYIDFVSDFKQLPTLERITFCIILDEMFVSNDYPFPLSEKIINA